MLKLVLFQGYPSPIWIESVSFFITGSLLNTNTVGGKTVIKNRWEKRGFFWDTNSSRDKGQQLVKEITWGSEWVSQICFK